MTAYSQRLVQIYYQKQMAYLQFPGAKVEDRFFMFTVLTWKLKKIVSINSYQVTLPYKIYLCFFFRRFDFARLNSSYRDRSSLLFRFRDAPHSIDSSGRVISLSQRPLPENTQQSQETDIHAPGRIRSRNPRKRVAEDPRLRPSGHRGMPFRGLDLHFMKTVRLAVTSHWRVRFPVFLPLSRTNCYLE